MQPPSATGRRDGRGETLSNREHSTQSVGRGFVSWGAGSERDGAAYHLLMLDRRDLDILGVLQRDARATYSDIGKQVGLSPSSVHQRVRKLEESGVIRGYRASVNLEALGLYVTALVAAMPLDPTQADDLPERVRELPEVEDCYSVAGEANYILKVRTGTTEDLEDLLRRIREKAGVQTRTTIVLSIPFEDRPVGP